MRGLLVALLLAMGVSASAAPRQAQRRERTIVFSSGHQRGFSDHAATLAVDAGMYLPVTLREKALGREVTWHSGATRTDVIDTLKRGEYDHVIFVGHGSQGSFWARDGSVDAQMLKDAGVPKLRGECIQHTCGAPKAVTMRDVLLKDPSRAFHHHRVIGTMENFGRALGLLSTTLLRRPTLGGVETRSLELRGGDRGDDPQPR